jgi:hypothetical protein
MAMSRANMSQQISKPGGLAKVGKVMREFKEGTLHSGKKGPVVKNRKQAVAIALSEAGMSKPKKKMAMGGGIDGCAVRGRTRG